MLKNRESACFSIKKTACEIMECVSLADGGWLFHKNFNQWTSMNILVYKVVF